jgi:diaminohydroxyphosphoribosylaminopyrimidine deaminase / 5-amino-6-(5-phosphoribosylamino)uracil reductase
MDQSARDNFFMNRCLQLAVMGLGSTAPNPLVGCVLVHQQEIIGEGYHMKYGGPHAEVNAVKDVRDKERIPLATLYVNLEPCSHYGKTPPCAEMIIRQGIKRVVVAVADPFHLVAGRGIQMLRKAGVEVCEGVMEKEALDLNRRFFTFHQKKRPYIILKWAQTEDGFMDRERSAHEAGIQWITDGKLKSLVHRWRTEEAAIMVGTRTALIDNPQLSAREWPGNNPLRILIDRELRLPAGLALFDNTTPTLVLNSIKSGQEGKTEYEKMNFGADILPPLFEILYKRGIQSLIVEGGKVLLESFIRSGCWDEARVLTGSVSFGRGLRAPDPGIEPMEQLCIGKDQLSIYRNPDSV